tara:strand:- start:525 stop:830 length:306 start_codon:yes stop_codon:yes gene_type:complete
MEGLVVQFRRGRHRIHERQFLLDLGFSSRDEAAKAVGKKVVWESSGGKKIDGEISSAHGNNGLVRAIFERGLPGQAVTTKVEVVGVGGGSGKGSEKKEGEK